MFDCSCPVCGTVGLRDVRRFVTADFLDRLVDVDLRFDDEVDFLLRFVVLEARRTFRLLFTAITVVPPWSSASLRRLAD